MVTPPDQPVQLVTFASCTGVSLQHQTLRRLGRLLVAVSFQDLSTVSVSPLSFANCTRASTWSMVGELGQVRVCSSSACALWAIRVLRVSTLPFPVHVRFLVESPFALPLAQRILGVDVAQQAGVLEQAGADHVCTVHFAAVFSDDVFVEPRQERVIGEGLRRRVAVLHAHQRIAEVARVLGEGALPFSFPLNT